MALIETKEFLSTNVSTNSDNWIWRNLHVRDYVNLPWSRTPLKFLFHRTTPAPGNKQTINVSGISERKNRDEIVISGSSSANYKMLV